jgi:PASTA domain
MLRRQEMHAMLGVTLAVVVSAVVGSAPAASANITSTVHYVPLAADLQIRGTVTDPEEVTVVVSTDLALRAGESRRISDQLALTLSSSDGAEVDNILVCSYLDPHSGWQEVGRQSAGTNHPGSGSGVVVLTNSLLLQNVANTGTYRCEIRSYTSDGRTDYYETALKYVDPTTGTWLGVSDIDEVGSQQWQSQSCDPRGTLPGCVYLGAPGDPAQTYVFQPPHWTSSLFTSSSDSLWVDVVGTLQVTSCPHDTSSCTSSHWGDNGWWGTGIFKTKEADVDSWLDFDQLFPDGSVCQQNRLPDPGARRHQITNSVHHLPIAYHLGAEVSPLCNGSRTFRIRVSVMWDDGNPVKIDGGSFNAINRFRSDTATPVANVIGATTSQATATLQAQGFVVQTTGQVNPAPAGTVFAQNAPSGTVEPTGSLVYLTVSLGSGVVPDVRSYDQASAVQRIVDSGLSVGTISSTNTCVDPGTVQSQQPSAGITVALGTPVNIAVSTCTNTGGGGGPGGGNGGGGPQPK